MGGVSLTTAGKGRHGMVEGGGVGARMLRSGGFA